jgi:heme exporter protein D
MPDFQFASFADFLAMGGYGLYVWSSYAVFIVVVTYNVMQPKLARKKFFKQQAALIQRDNARKGQS